MVAGRPLQFDPDIALNSAMQLFWRRGYEATSLHKLLQTMAISKSSFYQTFNSKPQLFEQSLRQYRQLSLERMQRQLDRAGSGRSFIRELIYAVADETGGPDARRGCLLLNTANEFAQNDPQIANLVGESLRQITSIFEQAIRRAQAERQLAQDKDPRALAHYLMSSLSGLKNMVKAGADRASIISTADIILQALD